MRKEDFQSVAANFPDPFRLILRDSVASTNDELQQLAKDGAPHGWVLLADEQTSGRGRRGNSWCAPGRENLTFSILLRPNEAKVLWSRLALASGLALAESLENFGLQAGIKWPNDIWLNGLKVAGILVEAGADFAIVGIGLNVHTTEFPPEIAASATSLALAMGEPPSRPELLATIIRRLAIRLRGIGAEFPKLIQAVNQRCVLSGNRVVLQTAKGPQSGIVRQLGVGGELLLETRGGIMPLIQADEVRIVEP